MDKNRENLKWKIARDSYLFLYHHGLWKKNKNDMMKLEKKNERKYYEKEMV